MACGPHRPSADAFTIHGLWPERADGSWPQYCGRSDSWTPADLAPLLPRLRAAWPSFGASADPAAFWAHEWLRHGTCAGLPGGPRAFFEAVLGDDTRERHTNQVKKNLLKSEHLQVQEQLIHYRSRRATIASDRMCPVCNKRIGTRYARSRRRACALRAPT